MIAKQSSVDRSALSAEQYDRLWAEMPDFIRYNPGARHRRRIVTRLVRGRRFTRLLDVGCGNAELIGMLRPLIGPDVRVEGSDLSPQVVKRNQSRFPDVSFHVYDIERAPLPRQYDLIICSEVVEHLNDQRAAIEHLAAGLVEGGHLLLTTPTGRMYATEVHFGHTNHLTPAEIDAFARDAGLQVVRVINWGWPFYKMLKWATNVRTEWAIRNFASGRYSRAAKLISGILYYLNFFNLNSPWGCQLFVLLRRG